MLDFEILFQKHKFMCSLSKVPEIGVKVEQLENYRTMTKSGKKCEIKRTIIKEYYSC